ncbi:MAG: ABC transporter permease [Acidimicrobiia bacterium]|nr:ABC transporter permease [Acidimicrobiia bacterium]MDX2467780.1 ABC transporter permease [Acidimicrobiia bacterium]
MRAAFIIALKDLSQRIRDKSAILLGVVAPLGLALIFSGIIPDTSGSSFDVNVGVVNNDGGVIAAGFIDDVIPAVAADDLLDSTTYTDVDIALADVESGDLSALYIFPAGFSDSVQSGTGGSVRLVGNVDQSIPTQIAKAVLDGYLAEIDAVSISVATAAVSGAVDVPAIADAATTQAAAVALIDVAADNLELDATTFFSAGMAVFFLFFTVQFGVSSLLEERIFGTLRRLLGAPISRWSIIGGKAITSFVLGLVSMLVLAVATTFMIGAQWGNPVGVGILMVCGVLSALGIMAVVAVVSRTPEQAANWQAIVAVGLGLLGGTFFPLSQGPRLLALFSKLTPHAWFLQGLGDLSAGGDLTSVITPALALVTFFVVTVGASMAFGKEVLAP